MAQIFLSYDRDDAAKAETLATAIDNAGHKVWWDQHIRGGAQYSKEIDQALKAADAVVVLWSASSVDSAWVRDEAAAGRDSGRLVPVALDGTEPPLGFRQYQTIDLSEWRGRGLPLKFESLLEAVSSLSGHPPAPTIDRRRPRPSRPGNFKRYAWMAVPLIVLVALALALWKPWSARTNAPVVAVGPAEPSAAAAALARDLFIKLGNLRSARTQSMRLVEHPAKLSSRPDLYLETRGQGDSPNDPATLVLLAGRDRTLLWSKEFQRAGNKGDLSQQLAYTAAQVLDCALDVVDASARRLDRQTRGLYLTGCAQQAELMGTDPTDIVPSFLQVTEKAPWFKPGWAKLLWAESSLGPAAGQARDREQVARIRKHIVQARRIDPTLAEAVLAEVSLLPRTALVEKLRMLERALAEQPSNANLLSRRSVLLGAVGRWKDAVEDARRASRLEPLSPGFRHAFISALAYSGQTEAAFAELEKAERLWPGASNMIDARFRLHFRYGDPKEALRLLRTSAIHMPASVETVLTAKVDPTPENVERAKTLVRRAVRDYPNQATGPLQAFPEFGIEAELFEIFSRWDKFEPDTLAILFRPTFRKFQRDPRFMQLAMRSGAIAYWQSSGKWPDFCFDPDLPYDCKAKAAKLTAKAS